MSTKMSESHLRDQGILLQLKGHSASPLKIVVADELAFGHVADVVQDAHPRQVLTTLDDHRTPSSTEGAPD